jgi:hypothetical protein
MSMVNRQRTSSNASTSTAHRSGSNRAIGVELDILNAYSAYSQAIDRNEWHRLEEAFTTDAVWVLADGSEFHGLDAIRAQLIGNTPNRPAMPLHLPFNIYLSVNGDRCDAKADWIFYGARPGTDWGIVSFGRYEDHLQRTEVGWRFSYRRISKTLDFAARS